ncbi:MAG: STAS domain-containing protein [Opitutales bacterium]
MPDSKSPVFLIDAYSEPAVLRIEGRANYLNCTPVGPALEQLVRQGKGSIAVDFGHCGGMDSTFLGIMAGVALALRRRDPPGELLLCRMGERNRELVHNLGLHRIARVVEGEPQGASHDPQHDEALESKPVTHDEEARIVLQAHKNLVEADQSNARRFEDVITFLKNQVEES